MSTTTEALERLRHCWEHYRMSQETAQAIEAVLDSIPGAPASPTACSVASLPEPQGVSALRVPPAGAWISVDEQTPPAQEVVLVWVDAIRYGEDDHGADCSAVDFGHWQANVCEHSEPYMDNYAGQLGDTQRVTHWMPLPEPPCASDRNPQGGDANAAPGRSPESAVPQERAQDMAHEDGNG
jgi:hypothetical protein